MNNIILTTTNSIDGWKIESYVKIISEKYIVGTGFFSDMFASVSDVIGGESNTYDSQFKKLYDGVFKKLEKAAQGIDGVNAVVGIKFDYDEISGKGKQMFMITATGTAVKTVKIKNDTHIQNLKALVEDLIIESLAYNKIDELEYKKIRIIRLIAKINDSYKVMEELGVDLVSCYKIFGMYAIAEDILYELIEEENIKILSNSISNGVKDNRDIAEYGMRFYEELLIKTDEELQNGNLPRDEVEDGLKQLKMKYC